MTDLHPSDSGEHRGEPGKTRTWWHPLFARLLDHASGTAYQVLEEVSVGKLPLRLDILLIRREAGQLTAANRQELGSLLPLLNRLTLIQFKGPTDALQRGDFAHLVGYSMLWHGQQLDPIPHNEISLVVSAPTVNQGVREELQLLGCEIHEHEAGIHRVAGPLPFAAWLVENDVLAQRGQAILSLVSRVFLRERKRIIQQLTDAGHLGLLYYALQQVAQFRRSGERFTMDHKDVKYMGEVEEELQMAVLESIPTEKRLQGIPPEERLQGIPPEQWLRGLPPEERLRGLGLTERLRGVSFEELVGDLSEEQRAQLRALLERQSGN